MQMKESTPDDIAVLCSHVNVDRNRYRVFFRENDDFRQVAIETANEGVAADPIQSESPFRALPAIRSSVPASVRSAAGTTTSTWAGEIATSLISHPVDARKTSPFSHAHGQRRALRSLWRKADSESTFGREYDNPDRLKHQSVSIFAVAGGTGATTLSATLARLFSRQQERVAILDGRRESILPFYFGAKSGVYASQGCVALQNSQDAAIHIVTADLPYEEPQTREGVIWESLKRGLEKLHGEVDRVLIDSWSNIRTGELEEFCTAGVCFVVAVPDLSSVFGIQKIGKYLAQVGPSIRPIHILNKFDESQPLHVEVRDWLTKHSIDHNIVTLRQADEVSEALAEGMTVIDYAPDSGIAEDYFQLGAMIRVMAEATTPVSGRNL
jgi:cellulose biosynthesis protein BcsQ